MLLAHCMTVHAVQESDLVVLTTTAQLRREIKSQLTEALAEALPELCSSQNNLTVLQPLSLSDDAVAAIQDRVADGINATVRNAVVEFLAPLVLQLSHLVTPGLSPSHPATSCREILQLAPQSPSGLYWIRASEHAAKHIPLMYCDMEKSCNGVSGGWMRLASINMTDRSHQCPSGLRTLEEPRRLCAMNTDSPGCSSTVFSVQGVQYSRVCGKIIGYQQKTPDAFDPYNRGGQRIIMLMESV